MPYLPDELWLRILHHVPPQDIWLGVRPINKQLAACAEDAVTGEPISKFTVGITLSLAAGQHHRWYDVRASITFTFKEFNERNAQYALFGNCLVHPQNCHDRTMEKWNQITAKGLGDRQEWKVQHGYEGDMRTVRLPRLVVADGEGVWCDWKELFDAYFSTSKRPYQEDKSTVTHASVGEWRFIEVEPGA